MAERDDLGGWLAVGGAGAGLVGSLLPWAQVTAPFIGTVSKAGTEGDGVITLLLALAIGVMGIAVLRGSPARSIGIVIAIAGALGAAICLYDLVDIQQRFADVDQELVKANVGVGLILTGLGMGVAVAGGLGYFSNPEPAAAYQVPVGDMTIPPSHCQKCGAAPSRPPTRDCVTCGAPMP